MNEITVKATRWTGGWELEIDKDHHTQSRTLETAIQQVRDYLDTDQPDIDHSTWIIHIAPQLPEMDQVAAARQATHDAAEAQLRAADQLRAMARKLREAGLSTTDAATILGVTRGRISQLTRSSR